MGFATFVLKGVHPFAAIGWKLAKLIDKLKNSRGPLPALEKVAVFGLDLAKPDLAMAYFVGRAVVDKVLASRWANSTEKYLDLISEGQEVTLEQVNTAFEVTKHNRAPSELLSKAGFLYLAECLKKAKAGVAQLVLKYNSSNLSNAEAGDAQLYSKYTRGARFDKNGALSDFYGTEASLKLADALGQYDHKTLTPAVKEQVLVPLAEQAWEEVQAKTRNDIVDLLLL